MGITKTRENPPSGNVVGAIHGKPVEKKSKDKKKSKSKDNNSGKPIKDKNYERAKKKVSKSYNWIERSLFKSS
ncbi:hypothetical protein LOK49_LG14G01469 [Camellia lanceoleosa]|uniref:Uncharacterized protein n=1 Tax=Camellia lanceoleosa TaxID=1840588 RepID=A0ACC0FAI9_9ERIC|nr:hypothetical protein LOK49_LG14G01469 [Camellia lanceoleosa]